MEHPALSDADSGIDGEKPVNSQGEGMLLGLVSLTRGYGHFEKSGSSSTALRSIKVTKEQALRHRDEQRDLWNVVGSWGDHTLDARRP